MARTKITREGAEKAPVDEQEPAYAESGLRWLKYAGIGSRRERGSAPRKLSGDDITSLGSLEAEIMGILWEIGGPATGMEVMELSLYKRRSRGQEPAAFATIATTLRRLAQKGVLKAYKNSARTPVYTPVVAREEMAARILNNVSVTLLGRPLANILPRLLGTAGAGQTATDPKEAAAVEHLIRALDEAASKEITVEPPYVVVKESEAPE